MTNYDLLSRILFQMGKRPSGGTDSGGRWHPSDTERCTCCQKVYQPSRAYSWTLYKHCHTRKHIRQTLLENPLTDIQKEALAMTVEDAPRYINHPNEVLQEYATALLARKTPIKKEALP